MVSADHLALIIPVQNEAGNVQHVIEGFSALKRAGAALVGEIVVVDNNSTDSTADIARAAGATVVSEPQRGYGRACQRGLDYLARRSIGPPTIITFVDGNGSAEPEELHKLIAPIESDEADFVLGTRRRLAARGSVTFQQRFGNRLACGLIKWIYGMRYTDLAPFRAINWPSLMQLEMRDLTYGWSIEMQVKAAKRGLRIREVDVRTYPRMTGCSKVSGTIRGVVGASSKIVTTILRYR